MIYIFFNFADCRKIVCILTLFCECNCLLWNQAPLSARAKADSIYCPCQGHSGLIVPGPLQSAQDNPYALDQLHCLHCPQGVCEQKDKPGSGSKLFCISSWAMTWLSDHPVPGRSLNMHSCVHQSKKVQEKKQFWGFCAHRLTFDFF
jgi:hypothetical protein